MWIFNFTPDWVWHLIFAVGVIGTFIGFVFGFIPFIKQYIIPVRIVSLLILLFGIFMEGSLWNNNVWQAKIKELEEKVAQAEAKAAQTSEKIQERVVTKTQIVKEKGDEIIKYVDREVVKKEEIIKYIENCPVPKEIIDAHNAATMLNDAAKKVEK